MGNQYYETETQQEYDARRERSDSVEDDTPIDRRVEVNSNPDSSGCLVALVGGVFSLGAGGLGVYECVKHFIN